MYVIVRYMVYTVYMMVRCTWYTHSVFCTVHGVHGVRDSTVHGVYEVRDGTVHGVLSLRDGTVHGVSTQCILRYNTRGARYA